MKAYDLSKIEVLVVEPNGFMRQLIRNVLHELGVRTLRDAPDAATAISMFKTQPTDIVLTDWSPKLNGAKLLSWLRGQASPYPFVPVIVVSAHTEVQHICKARDMGMTEYLAKPVSARGVYDRIVRSIENRREFVNAQSYFGPDRRRHRKDTQVEADRRHHEIAA